MSVGSYKCPNCDGGVIFDPAAQEFRCEYCQSRFTREDLEELPLNEEEPHYEAPSSEEKPPTGKANEPLLYHCPSCGAEIVTDETTAATECYYCHNPVVLSGRLKGEFLPDRVLPFVITQNQATEAFMNWVKKKWFVPRSFFSKAQIEKLTGVYYPYWVLDCDMEASLTARAATIRVWRGGNTEYTETKHYQVHREGSVLFRELTKNALHKADHTLAEGVQPFDLEAAKAFVPAYLSGFQAEKRDMERDSLQGAIEAELKEYTRSMMTHSISGYTSVSPEQLQATPKDMNWRYMLLPVWVLTYKATGKRLYYYAMNGQTGKVCGVLPVDWKRLGMLFAGVTLPLMGLLLLGGLLL